ncbi:hypothetical protein [Legionella brunensis]|uniref:HEAT repeat protein n=1 Tax=Legionella brunensis TaxID=29422 RepID=A0A0W0S1G6_9GAMM|nr:hypothetical protein [Legionella brunensis]KTC77012.1 hypothetical protein Lbru_3119 [Legionella brunensis]
MSKEIGFFGELPDNLWEEIYSHITTKALVQSSRQLNKRQLKLATHVIFKRRDKESLDYQLCLLHKWLQQNNLTNIPCEAFILWQVIKCRTSPIALRLATLAVLNKLNRHQIVIDESDIATLRKNFGFAIFPECEVAMEALLAISSLITTKQFDSNTMLLADKLYHSEPRIRFLALTTLKVNSHKIPAPQLTFILNRAVEFLENKTSLTHNSSIRIEVSLQILTAFVDKMNFEHIETIVVKAINKLVSIYPEEIQCAIGCLTCFSTQISAQQINLILSTIKNNEAHQNTQIQQTMLKALRCIAYRLDKQQLESATRIITTKFNHKEDKVRQEALLTFQTILDKLDKEQLTPTLPHIIAQLSENFTNCLISLQILKNCIPKINLPSFHNPLEKIEPLLKHSNWQIILASLEILPLLKLKPSESQGMKIIYASIAQLTNNDANVRNAAQQTLALFADKVDRRFLRLLVSTAIADLNKNKMKDLIAALQVLTILIKHIDEKRLDTVVRQITLQLNHPHYLVVQFALETFLSFSDKIHENLRVEVNQAITKLDPYRFPILPSTLKVLQKFGSTMNHTQIQSLLNTAISQLKNTEKRAYKAALQIISSLANWRNRDQLGAIIPDIMAKVEHQDFQVSHLALKTLIGFINWADMDTQKNIIQFVIRSLKTSKLEIRGLALEELSFLLVSGKINSSHLSNLRNEQPYNTSCEVILITILAKAYENCLDTTNKAQPPLPENRNKRICT